MTNKERGEIIRKTLAMISEARGSFGRMDPSNFFDIEFRNKKLKVKKPGRCTVCNNIFDEIDKIVKNAYKKIKKYEFNSFLVGTTNDGEIREKEEKLWDEVGIEFCETFRSEFNREVGKRLEGLTGKKADFRNPDINVLVDVKNKTVEVKVNSLFIYGEYQKLVRGIPQTKWPGKYRTSVEEIIARPIMKLAKGGDHKFHGMGREDVDALCLGWRPFVIEITRPRKRFLDLRLIEKMINKDRRVKVRNLSYVKKDVVRRIKDYQAEKIYQIDVECAREIKMDDLKKLRKLSGTTVHQKTPTRVLHRRANKIRKRKLVKIWVRKTGKKALRLKLRTESGFYVKEFVHGDNGRTRPSVSSVLGCKCEPKNLIVLKIFYKRSDLK